MKKVLFLANHFITLYSFRKELIKKLVDDGNEVYLSIPESDDNSYFTDMGCKVINTTIDRRGVNPIKDIKPIRTYRKMFKSINPDIIFSYTIKPNIYGCLASNKTGHRQICNITGTGATFLKKSIISMICIALYRISIKKCYKVFFQNTGDRDYFISNHMVADNYLLLPGSGCNMDEHPYCQMKNEKTVRFIFIGRVMKLKGIDEYLKCADVIKSLYPETVFYVAGWNEEEEYKTIISDYQQRGIIDYIGFRKDIAEWIKNCHCTILPSHGGEGVPNVLLESAATGRVCIASMINGSADVVEDGVTGYLFEAGNAEDLINCVKKYMALSYDRRDEMGIAGHKKVEKEFNRNIIINKYCQEVENV